MRVLLTGSAGFIGRAIAEQLRARGDDVVEVDLLLPQAHGSEVDRLILPPGQSHRLDVRAAQEWVDLLRGVDVVCHQAAMVGSGVDVSDFPDYAAHNDLGTACLLAAMHQAGVRKLVFASSMVIYGEGRYLCPSHGDVVPAARPVSALQAGDFDNVCPVCATSLTWGLVPEDARPDPRSAYAASKLAQEHYVAAWARETGGSAIGLRYHNVYGPWMPRGTPYSGVAAMFRTCLEQNTPSQVYEDGGQMRDFVHVSDVARANLLALAAVDSVHAPTGLRCFNVCSGQPISILGVAELIAGAHGIDVTGQYRLGDARHVVASPERARHELGFVAEISPDRGLPQFVFEPLRSLTTRY